MEDIHQDPPPRTAPRLCVFLKLTSGTGAPPVPDPSLHRAEDVQLKGCYTALHKGPFTGSD